MSNFLFFEKNQTNTSSIFNLYYTKAQLKIRILLLVTLFLSSKNVTPSNGQGYELSSHKSVVVKTIKMNRKFLALPVCLMHIFR